jgi:hypothetical protein
MGKNKRDDLWAEAKKKCRLNNETIRMAKELGINPKTLIKNIPNKSEPWKAPVHEWVRDMYEKKQAKESKKRPKKTK